jgi:cell division protein FtsB
MARSDSPQTTESRRQPLAQSALKWSLLGLLAFSLTLGTNLFRPTLRGMQVSADIVRRSREYHEQVRANDALEQELAFLQTEPGKQWAVHKYMGMIKPGEQVGQTVEEAQPKTRPLTRPESVRAWVGRQEACSSARIRELRHVASCYAGLRPPDQANTSKPAETNKPGKVSNHQAQALSKQASKASGETVTDGGKSTAKPQ